MIAAFILTAYAGGGIHLRVDGEGLFRFARGTQAVYCSEITLSTSSGVLSTPEGYPLLPQIRVPASGKGVTVQMDGTVSVLGKPAGHIVLALFGQTQLQKVANYYTSASRSSIGYPGDGLFGVIKVIGAGSSGPTSPALHVSKPSISPTIEVGLRAEVTGDHIYLKDIAQIGGTGPDSAEVGDTDLGVAPLYGSQRGITRSYILAKLRSEGINTDRYEIVCPTGAIVVRKGQTVTAESLIQAAAKAVKDQLGVDFEMRSERTFPDLTVPTGDLQLNTLQAIQSGDGASVSMEVDVDGKAAARRTVYLVPTVPIPMVRAGDPVKIRLIKNGATVEIAGRCRSTAKVGTSITVESETGAAFTGILRTASLVEVKL